MGSDTTIAIGPGGMDDYQKLTIDELGRLRSISSVQGLTIGGRVTLVSLSDSAWVELPAVQLSNRNSISIQNQSGNGNAVFMNYSASAPHEGVRIEDGGFRSLAISGTIKVYARMEIGSGVVAVEELA